MIKITISIKEVPEKKSELIVSKYLIATSNFGDADILGIPCKIMSEPYIGTKRYLGKRKTGNYIKVMSCITGIEYEIPYSPDWFNIYDSFEKVLDTPRVNRLLRHGLSISRNPLLSTVDVVGKKYYPIDNSYAENFKDGSRLWVSNKVVTIISKPYIARTPHGNSMQFVIVKTEDGEVGKCLFMEWKLVP